MVEQASITSSNRVFQVIRNLPERTTFSILLEILIWSGNRTILGSGLHHRIMPSSLNHEKIPLRYAKSNRSGAKSPPTANNPSSSAFSTSGNNKRSVRKYIWNDFSL